MVPEGPIPVRPAGRYSDKITRLSQRGISPHGALLQPMYGLGCWIRTSDIPVPSRGLWPG